MRPIHLITSALVVAPLALGCEKKEEPICPKGAEVTLAGNHGHSSELASEKLKKGSSAQAPVKGGSHEHALVLRSQDVETLATSKSVKSRTSSVNAHVHEIEVRCKP